MLVPNRLTVWQPQPRPQRQQARKHAPRRAAPPGKGVARAHTQTCRQGFRGSHWWHTIRDVPPRVRERGIAPQTVVRCRQLACVQRATPQPPPRQRSGNNGAPRDRVSLRVLASQAYKDFAKLFVAAHDKVARAGRKLPDAAEERERRELGVHGRGVLRAEQQALDAGQDVERDHRAAQHHEGAGPLVVRHDGGDVRGNPTPCVCWL